MRGIKRYITLRLFCPTAVLSHPSSVQSSSPVPIRSRWWWWWWWRWWWRRRLGQWRWCVNLQNIPLCPHPVRSITRPDLVLCSTPVLRKKLCHVLWYYKLLGAIYPSLFICKYSDQLMHAVAQLVEALGYEQEGRGFDSRWRHWNFLLT